MERDGTAAVYEWNVRTARPWMNRLAPVARPLFAWNHDVVMRQGAEGLPLDVQVVAHPWRDDVALAVALHLERELAGDSVAPWPITAS